LKPAALIFRLEGLLADIEEADYSKIMAGLKQKDGSTLTRSSTTTALSVSSDASIFQLLTSLQNQKKIDQAEYDKIQQEIDQVEEEQITKAHLLPGVKNGLASTQGMKLKTIVVSDLGMRAVAKFLEKNELKLYFDSEVPRNKISTVNETSKRIMSTLKKLKIEPKECIFFCNTLTDLQQAKLLRMRVVVLPSKKESSSLLLQAKPDGMIISLEELPSLLALSSWQVDNETGKSSKVVGRSLRKVA
jgi:phosphoglycolate phosphatase-like HAD superfamily hydrolase